MKRWILALAFGVAFQGMFCDLWAFNTKTQYIILHPRPAGENQTVFASEKAYNEFLRSWETTKGSPQSVQYDDEKAMFIYCDCRKGQMKAFRGERCRVQERDAAAGKTREVHRRWTEAVMDAFTKEAIGNSKCDGCSRSPQVKELVGTRKRQIRTLEQIETIDRERERELKLREQQNRERSRQKKEADPRWQKEQEKKKKNKEKSQQWLEQQNRAFEERQRRMEERQRGNN